MNTTEHHPIVVIGGGQSGLAVSYHLSRRGLEHAVLDANKRAGDGWRRRWDSLRLFTPTRIDHLDGLAFPRRGDVPTKDEFADYLESYEETFALPVRHGVRVERVSAESDGFALRTSAGPIRADSVVVAMSSLQTPRVPACATDLDPGMVSLHSSEYRNPAQLQEGDVLVVGVGNSGAEISVDVAPTHRTWLAGRESGHLPFRLDGWFGQHIATRVIAPTFLHVLNTDTSIGRKAQPKMQSTPDPLMRERPKEFRRLGIKRIPRITEVRDGKPVAEDGTVLDVTNVIWCTGYRMDLADWIDLPVFDDRGMPRQNRGVVPDQPGLYFVGQEFMYAKASGQIPGVSRDARYVAEAIDNALRSSPLRTAG